MAWCWVFETSPSFMPAPYFEPGTAAASSRDPTTARGETVRTSYERRTYDTRYRSERFAALRGNEHEINAPVDGECIMRATRSTMPCLSTSTLPGLKSCERLAPRASNHRCHRDGPRAVIATRTRIVSLVHRTHAAAPEQRYDRAAPERDGRSESDDGMDVANVGSIRESPTSLDRHAVRDRSTRFSPLTSPRSHGTQPLALMRGGAAW